MASKIGIDRLSKLADTTADWATEDKLNRAVLVIGTATDEGDTVVAKSGTPKNLKLALANAMYDREFRSMVIEALGLFTSPAEINNPQEDTTNNQKR